MNNANQVRSSETEQSNSSVVIEHDDCYISTMNFKMRDSAIADDSKDEMQRGILAPYE